MNQLSPSRVNPARFMAILFVAALVSCIDLFNDPEVAGSASDEQTKTLMGTVIDVNNMPVQGVEAELSVKALRCTTDEKGVFRFSVKENHAALMKAASGTVLDTLTLSFDGQRFYLELVTQWDTTFAPVVMASKSISGSVPARLPGIQELTADFNPAAPASKLNAEIGLTLDRETGEFSGKVYYAVESPDQSFILDISAIGWNGEIVFSNLKFTFTHQTPLIQKGRIQYPSPGAVCDTCGSGKVNIIFALSDLTSLPHIGLPLTVHYIDSNLVAMSDTLITNSEGSIFVPNQPLLVTGSPLGCDAESLYITGLDPTAIYHLRFQCHIPIPDIFCDSCFKPYHWEIAAVDDSTGRPLDSVLLIIHSRDTVGPVLTPSFQSGLWTPVDTLITDFNGNAKIHDLDAPLAVIGFAPECGADTMFIPGLMQTRSYPFRFDCQIPAREPVCDTCDMPGFFTITALNGSGLQPLIGFAIDIQTEDFSIDIQTKDTIWLMRNYTMITDTNGMVPVPYTKVPLTVVVYSGKCDAGDSLFISDAEQNRNYNVLFDCQDPAQDSLCDSCSLPASFFITALNGDSLPLAGAQVTLALHSTSGRNIKYGSKADANGRVEARYIPGLMNVVGIIPGCGADSIFISEGEQNRDYHFMFDCQNPAREPLCDTCDQPEFSIITAIDSNGLPLKDVLMEIHSLDTGQQMGTDTMITDGNGSITIPYFPGPFSVTARHPGFRADTITFSGLEQKGNRFLWLSKLPEICREVGAPGTCKAAFPGYYYDQRMGGCVEFTWGGCDGNRPFNTLDSCQSICE